MTTPTKTLLLKLHTGIPALLSKSTNPNLGVSTWLFGCTSIVATIVHVGGITRLTKSGLSMTDWKPLGSLPPLSDQEWEEEFERYKQFPEFAQRESMTMKEFQFIYYWEWGHRMLGRTVGVAFALPWAYFTLRHRIPPGFQPKMAGLFTLGGTQGLIGWWMVRSGLDDHNRQSQKEIRVSPYRLATHLCFAATTYSLLFYTGLEVLHLTNQAKVKELTKELLMNSKQTAVSLLRRTRIGAMAVTGLTGVTLASGAFVAGNDAGRAYNTFPKMTEEEWIPWEDIWDPSLSPAYRNLFETTATVQFNHRVLGMTTAASAITLASFGLFHPATRAVMTPQVVRGMTLVGGVATAQATLGITTLLHYVPIGLAAAHQLGSLALVTSGFYLVHSLRYVRPALIRSVQKELTGMNVSSVVTNGGIKPLLKPV